MGSPGAGNRTRVLVLSATAIEPPRSCNATCASSPSPYMSSQLVPTDPSMHSEMVMPSQTTSARYSLDGWRRHSQQWRAAQRLSEALLVLVYHAYLAWCVLHGWHRGGWCSGGRFLLALTLLVYASLAVFGAAAVLEAVTRSRPGLGSLFAW